MPQPKIPDTPDVSVKPTELLPPAEDAPIVKAADVQPTDIMGLLSQAIARGTPIETIERLEQMHERMIARQAEAAFNVAKAQFHIDCPPLIRGHENRGYTRLDRAGRSVPSRYTNLEDMEATVGPALTKNGFSWDWGDMEENVERQQLSLPFVLTHIGGHQRMNRATLPTTPGEGAERKKTTAQQSRFSVVTYLQRLSMRLGLGLGGGEYDDDGAGDGKPVEPISAAQLKEIYNYMLDVKADFAGFLKHFSTPERKITDLKDLPADRYAEAVRMLDIKRKQQESQNG